MTFREAERLVHELRRAGFVNAYRIPLTDGRHGLRLSTDYGARVCFEVEDVRQVIQTSARVGRHIRGDA